jgi:hypothetical protein
MSKSPKKKRGSKVNINLTPTKRRKKQTNHNCILNCTAEKKEYIIKFSKKSR